MEDAPARLSAFVSGWPTTWFGARCRCIEDRLATTKVLNTIHAAVRRIRPGALLSDRLEELSKIYGSMEDELVTYLSLYFDNSDPKQLARERPLWPGSRAVPSAHA